VFFNAPATIAFIRKIKEYKNPDHMRLVLHGGEPLLAPLPQLISFCEEFSDLSLAVQTNLVYKLSEDKLKFFQKYFDGVIGTSWDSKIRFKGDDEKLWEKNVKALINNGLEVEVCISITKYLIEIPPSDLLEKMESLGVTRIIFERVTNDGNAKINNVSPDYIKMDEWLYLVYQDTSNIKISTIEEIVEGVKSGGPVGDRCRDCQQKIFTINADGTVGGCPNSAQGEHWSTIYHGPEDLFNGPKRAADISCEIIRDVRCYRCDLFSICNGDCHKLLWQGDNCPAPKKILRDLKFGTNTTTT